MWCDVTLVHLDAIVEQRTLLRGGAGGLLQPRAEEGLHPQRARRDLEVPRLRPPKPYRRLVHIFIFYPLRALPLLGPLSLACFSLVGPLTPGFLPFTLTANLHCKKIAFLRSIGSQLPELSHSADLRELSAVSGSKPAKVCAPRISFFRISMRC